MTDHAKLNKTILITALVLTMAEGCIAPRANINSGKVTPEGSFTVGYDLTVNVPSNTAKVASSQLIEEYKAITNDEDKEYERDVLNEYSRLALAQALDPIGSSNQLYLRYGVISQLDVGLAYGSAGFIVDTAYQVLKEEESSVDASIGLQYSAQEFTLPSVAGDAQELLGFDFSRDDFLLRATVSLPFGPNEQYGAFGFGAALNYTQLRYGFTPENVKYITEDMVQYLSKVPSDEEGFLAYGGFVNLKVGYEYVYLLMSLNLYNQEYGTYNLPDGQTVTYKGWTLVPSVGLQATF